MLRQETQRLRQEAAHHLHVAVEDVDVFAARMLVAELRPGAAAALVRVHQLDDRGSGNARPAPRCGRWSCCRPGSLRRPPRPRAARLLSMAAQMFFSSLNALMTIDTGQRDGAAGALQRSAVLTVQSPAARTHRRCEGASAASVLPPGPASAAPSRPSAASVVPGGACARRASQRQRLAAPAVGDQFARERDLLLGDEPQCRAPVLRRHAAVQRALAHPHQVGRAARAAAGRR